MLLLPPLSCAQAGKNIERAADDTSDAAKNAVDNTKKAAR